MKILISADVEGISGISNKGQVVKDSVRYDLTCELYIKEVNAAIKACFDAGADEVIMVDGHGSGSNFFPHLLDKRVKLVQGTHRKYFMMDCIDQGVDYCILIGYHGMSNKLNSIMGHTNSSKTMPIVKVNGREAGEILMNTLLAKHFDSKVIFLSGTDKAIEEVDDLHLGIFTVCTKKSLSTQSGILKSGEAVRDEIYIGVKKAINNAKKVRMIKTKKEFCFEVSYPFTYQVQLLDAIPGVKIINDTTVSFTFDSYEKAHRLYRHIGKFVSSLLPY
jgi:D-amino peptidase|tara:strand:- start:58 stop:885 length:828 start_codon:yes stop_codon:yes gene_type:complete